LVIEAKLNRALARHLGATHPLENLRRVTGGATKSTWIFDLATGDGLRRLVLQLTSAEASGSDFLSTKLSAQNDAHLLRTAHEYGVPVPPVLALLDDQDELGAGHLTGWVEGETLAPKILREHYFSAARQNLTAQCAQALAAIHRIPCAATPFLKPMDAAAQWQHYRHLVDHHRVVLPALEWGLKWAQENRPPPSTQRVVHGDFRLGNLMVNARGLACILDWELAVVGDPMQDLAWLCLKTWRFGGSRPVAGVGERATLFAAYEEAGGQRVDPQRVRFWEAFGQVKWAIMCLSMGLGSASLEHHLIGRRTEEPLWDLLNMLKETDQ
jgi:aminoglycoside phosphotransferase (APT) family kinase protein